MTAQGASTKEGGDGGRGGGAGPEVKVVPARDGEAGISFLVHLLLQEEGSRDNAIHNDGGGISMVHRYGLRPDGGEVRA